MSAVQSAATASEAITRIELGVSLFCFTNEWLDGTYTLESMVEEVARRGVGPGLEVVGFQSFRGFPQLSDAQVRAFRELVDRTGLSPTTLGSNADVARRADRFMNADESTDYLAAQVDAARRLGFRVVRIQMGLTPEVIERVEPLARRAGVKLGMEIHAPQSAVGPPVIAVRELYERLDSEVLGFIPDFSATMTAVPSGQVDMLRAAGLTADGVALLEEVWHGEGTPHERFTEFAERATAGGEDAAVVQQARLMFSMFGHADPQTWRELLPRVVHVHAKFYDVVDQGGEDVEPAIPYPALLGILADGYRGYISSEWEGHAWADSTDVDAFELVARHQAMCRRLLAATEAAT